MLSSHKKPATHTARGLQPRSGLIALILLALVAALFGGSSRYDMWQTVVLYPLAALLLIPALWHFDRSDLRSVRVPLILLGLLAGWMALQIVPLPPTIWTALPGRSAIIAIDRQIDLDGIWRPISFDPMLTTNSLFGLIVILASILTFAALRGGKLPALIAAIAIGAVSGTIGLLQLMIPQTKSLFFYRITADGQAVGLLANNNHAGVLSALTMLAILLLRADKEESDRSRGGSFALLGLFMYMFLCGLASASRMGIATTLAAAAIGIIMLSFERLSAKHESRDVWRHFLLAAAGAIVLGVIALTLSWGRLSAIEQLSSPVGYEELRFQIFPTLVDMTRTFFWTGTGFGTFADVYHIFEPDALLTPQYINQAHNDWLQYVIEGGLPSVLILIALLIWLGNAARTLMRSGTSDYVWLIVGAGVVLVLAMASATDYALRAPAVGLVATWLVLSFGHRAWLRRPGVMKPGAAGGAAN